MSQHLALRHSAKRHTTKGLICDTQHNNALSHFAECRILFIIILNVIWLSNFMLSVVMLNVVMLSVIRLSAVAPSIYLDS